VIAAVTGGWWVSGYRIAALQRQVTRTTTTRRLSEVGAKTRAARRQRRSASV